MKHLFFLFAISLPLLLIGCSQDEQEIMPFSPKVDEPIHHTDKTSASFNYPFALYQTFPEMKGVKVEWSNNAKGLVITVSSPVKSAGQSQLFAVVEFADVDPAMDAVQMVYLGSSSKRTYLIRGIKNRIVTSVKIYLYNTDLQDKPGPYPESQLFNGIGIKGWAAADDRVKVSSEKFPARLSHLYAELQAAEGNIVVFLGKPSHEDFDFPKSRRLNVTNVRLLGYTTKQTGYDPYPIITQQ